MTTQQLEELDRIKDVARKDHERNRKNAKARGRIDFPLLPYECSWAFDQEFKRETSKGNYYNSFLRIWKSFVSKKIIID